MEEISYRRESSIPVLPMQHCKDGRNLIKGSLEVKLPTIWSVEKQRREVESEDEKQRREVE